MDDGELDRRIVALESALAHHQAEMRDLSDVIAGQWRVIDRLGQRLARLEALLARLDADAGGGSSPQD